MKRDNIIKYTIISVFVSLYFLVATISMIHSIKFFDLSNSPSMSITLSVAFELGQVAALCGILILDKTSKGIVWFLFLLLTSMQIMSNVYYSYVNLGDYKAWSELFGLVEEDPIFQKRVLSIISGGILPIVALGFIKSLVDYLKPQPVENQPTETVNNISTTVITATEDRVDETPVSEKLDVNFNIESELEEPIAQSELQETIVQEVVAQENVKTETPKKVNMPRTPGQYVDAIVGGGTIKSAIKKS